MFFDFDWKRLNRLGEQIRQMNTPNATTATLAETVGQAVVGIAALGTDQTKEIEAMKKKITELEKKLAQIS